jgi:apolipoprotein N-acyltransferase
MVIGTPYTAGDDPRPLALDGLRAGVLICFEAIYPDLARASVAAGADVLVNISNDGFFHVGGAEEQHFAGTVFRAVETRRPLVRVANLGAGALVDATGRVLQRVERRQRTMTVVEVTPRSGTTLFCAGGWILPWALGALALLGLIPLRAGSRER